MRKVEIINWSAIIVLTIRLIGHVETFNTASSKHFIQQNHEFSERSKNVYWKALALEPYKIVQHYRGNSCKLTNKFVPQFKFVKKPFPLYHNIWLPLPDFSSFPQYFLLCPFSRWYDFDRVSVLSTLSSLLSVWRDESDRSLPW